MRRPRLPLMMALTTRENLLFQSRLISGYASDDESSEVDEPMDSGRTRSSTRRQQQQSNSQSSSNANNLTEKTTGDTSSSSGKGTKRKKKLNSGGDGSGSDDEGGNDKNRLKLEHSTTTKDNNATDMVVCSCPKNVMKCIGILPSLPIVGYFNDHNSDDTDSSVEDLAHVVLPTVSRDRQNDE